MMLGCGAILQALVNDFMSYHLMVAHKPADSFSVIFSSCNRAAQKFAIPSDFKKLICGYVDMHY